MRICTKFLIVAGCVLQAAGVVRAQEVKGADVYRAACAMCHQASAQGAAGLAPPLQGTYWGKLGKVRSYVPGVLLAGLHGVITTDEGEFNGVMPSQSRLSDSEIAAVSTYLIREVNGQVNAPEITPSDVAKLRAKPASVTQLLALRKRTLAK